MTSGDPAVGSVAEEAARLIGLLCGDSSDAAARDAGMRAAARTGTCPTCGRDPSPSQPASEADAGPEPVCRYCPVCQLVGLVRGISPDVIDRVADVVDLVSGGLRDFADSRRRSAAAPPSEPPQ